MINFTKLAVTVLFASCAVSIGCCEHQIESEQTSPSRTHIAAVSVTNCGALSSYDTAVYLRPAGESFSANHSSAIGLRGRHSISILWKNDDTLIVYLPKSAVEASFADPVIVSKKDRVDGVAIEYRSLP